MEVRSISISCRYNEWQGYGTSIEVDDKGRFQHDAPIGSWIMLSASTVGDYAANVVNTQVTVKQKNGQYDLRFSKGIPVTVKVVYSDGTPAVDKGVSYRIDIPIRPDGEIENSYRLNKTDSQGECRLTFQPGTYTFQQSDHWRDEDQKTITISPGDENVTVDFTLPLMKKLKITCEDDVKPVVVCMNRIGFTEPDKNYLFGPELLDREETDKDAFELLPTPHGDLVSISANGGKYGIVMRIAPETTDEIIDITLPRAAKVTGRLLDKATGQPIPFAKGNFQQHIVDGEESHHIGINCVGVHFETDHDGNFVFGSHDRMRNYLALAVGGEYRDAKLYVFKKEDPLAVDHTLPLDIPPFNVTSSGETLDLGDILVENGITDAQPENERRETLVKGRVLMPDGTPVKNAKVVGNSRGITNSAVYGHHAFTNENGEYWISLMQDCELFAAQAYVSTFSEGVTPSHEAMYAGQETFEPLVSEIDAFFCPKNEITTHDFTLREAYPLQGIVRYADGTPVKNAHVFIRPKDLPVEDSRFHVTSGSSSMFSRGVMTDAEGNFQVYLSPGEYDADVENGLDASRTVEVGLDKTPTVELVMT